MKHFFLPCPYLHSRSLWNVSAVLSSFHNTCQEWLGNSFHGTSGCESEKLAEYVRLDFNILNESMVQSIYMQENKKPREGTASLAICAVRVSFTICPDVVNGLGYSEKDKKDFSILI